MSDKPTVVPFSSRTSNLTGSNEGMAAHLRRLADEIENGVWGNVVNMVTVWERAADDEHPGGDVVKYPAQASPEHRLDTLRVIGLLTTAIDQTLRGR